jgi:3-methyladenine DNA glycosylase AlkC
MLSNFGNSPILSLLKSPEMAENFELRDFYNEHSVTVLADSIKAVYTDFPIAEFKDFVLPPFPDLGLLERANRITDGFEKFLPSSFELTTNILIKNVEETLKVGRGTGVDSFLIFPHAQYVARNGFDHFDLSMKALNAFTRKFTSEFAIRPFIKKYPERTLAVLAEWTKDPNEHVRRLVSEGTRPLLPWAIKLNEFAENPEPCFQLLELLKKDNARYVQKSIANHLNDHSKKHPTRVVEILSRWQKEVKTKDMEWIIKHALRTLIKDGHPKALDLLGFGIPKGIELRNFKIEPSKVIFGDGVNFAFDIVSNAKSVANLVIDFKLYFKKSNGTLAPKVFKLTTAKLDPGASLTIQKFHPIRPITTRKYYPGEQQLSIQINGKEFEKLSFDLLMKN